MRSEVILGRSCVEKAGLVAYGEALAGAVALTQGGAAFGCSRCGIDFIGWRTGGFMARVVIARGSTGLRRSEACGKEEGSDGN